ncbi:MAG: response regulator [Bacteroidia bacterium]
MIVNSPKVLIRSGIWAAMSLLFFMARGQSDNPFIRNYPRNSYFSTDFNTAPQNWGFAQDTTGRMYIANTYGVLEFDGKYWRMIPGTEALSSIRVYSGKSGTIWVGGRADFGYLAPDPYGQLQFISVSTFRSDTLSASPGIRSIWESSDGIWFVATQGAWQWDPKSQNLAFWSPPGAIQNAFLQGGELFFRFEGAGICSLEGGEWKKYSNLDQGIPGKVQLVLSLSPESETPEDILLICQREGIYRLAGRKLTLWSEKLTQVVSGLQVWDAIAVPPDKIAFATHNQGLVIADTAGNFLHTYNREAGLISNSLITVFQDRQSGLWVTSDIGISRVDYPPGLQFFGYNSYLEGAVTAIARRKDRLWVGTTSGLFASYMPTRDAYLFFSKETPFLDEVWALAELDDELLIGATRGLFLRNNAGQYVSFFDQRVNTIVKSIVYQDRVYAGLENGVGVIEKEGGKWKWKGIIRDISHPVKTMAETPEGDLWVSYRAVSLLHFGNGPSLSPEVLKMGPENGFTRDLDIVEPVFAGGRSLFGTYNGIRVWDNTTQKIVADSAFPERFYNGEVATYLLKTDPSGRLWMSLGGENGWFDPGNPGEWHSQALNPVSSEVISLQTDKEGLVWVGTLEGLYRFNPDSWRDKSPPFHALLREVTATGGAVLYGGAGNPGDFRRQVSYSQNTLRFVCTSSSQKFPEQVKFRFKLEGYEKDWSEWTYSSTKEYTRLWEGNYRFMVQAKDLFETESPVRVYEFRILPPWYRSWWALLFYVFLLTLAIVWIVRRVFRKQQQKLQEKEAELELERETAERLRQVDRMKDEFLANTSHELRTPLNGIIGITEALFDQEKDTSVKQNLSMVIASGKRLSSLVNDLLDFSRIKNADLTLRQRPVDLRSVVDVVLQVSRPTARGKKLEMDNLVPEDIPTVFADEDRLTQVLYNLIGNAIKFTEKGQVLVSATLKEEMIEVSVSDTGIGVPREKWDSIFEAFEQADGSISRTYAGTGLGLSISKTLVERHGGRMWVDSVVGQGSTFYFTLPVSGEAAEAKMLALQSEIFDQDFISPDGQDTFVAGNTEYEGTDRIRILIVDDEPINHQVLKNYLRDSHYQVFSAMNGSEAMDILSRETSLDLVLLDVMMPRMSGYEVCRLIRERFLPSELPIIMITARNQVSDMVQGLNIGANDYLSKPFSRDEFLARLNTHLNLHRINRATSRFVPSEFIKTLGHNSITEVKLGDNIARDVTVLFSDIRDYTSLSESLTPDDNFRFVSAYARRMGPVIHEHRGFVNQYLGDGIMALFQQSPSDAIAAAIGMQEEIRNYNIYRLQRGRKLLKVGMGLHTGPLIMGIIGDTIRSEAAIIADTVNVASRLEGLTKYYHVNIILSESAYHDLDETQQTFCRYLGKVQAKGKKEAIGVYECVAGEEEHIRELKLSTIDSFNEGITAYLNLDLKGAEARMKAVLERYPGDLTTRYFLERIHTLKIAGIPEGWTGVEEMKGK